VECFQAPCYLWAACSPKGGRRSAVMFRVLSVGVLRNVYSWVRGLGVGQQQELMVSWSDLYEGVKDGIREYCLRVISIKVNFVIS